MRARALLRLLATSLPLVLLVPASAHAERAVTEDATGDVRLIDFGSDEDDQPAPDHVASDITRTVVAYGATHVEVTVHFRDLRTVPLLRTEVRLRTQVGGFFLTRTRIGGGRPRMTFVRKSGREVECPGLAGGFDAADDTVSISIPADCIGSPRWVQVGVHAGTIDEDLDPDELVYYVDDAHRDGLRKRGVSLGPKVRQG